MFQTEETVIVRGALETLVVLLLAFIIVNHALVAVEVLVPLADSAETALVAVVHRPYRVVREQDTHATEVDRHLGATGGVHAVLTHGLGAQALVATHLGY